MEFLGMWNYILLPSTDSFPPETRCQRELHSPTMIYPQPMASFIWQIMMRGYFRCDCLGHFFLCGPNMIMRFLKHPQMYQNWGGFSRFPPIGLSDHPALPRKHQESPGSPGFTSIHHD